MADQPTAAQAATQKAVEDALAAQKRQLEAEHKAALESAVSDATEKQRAAYESSAGPVTADDSSAPAEDTRGYELLADHYSEPRPDGKGYDPRVKGDTIRLTAVRAAELIAAGAVKDPDDGEDEDGEPGGQTKAPTTRRRGARA